MDDQVSEDATSMDDKSVLDKSHVKVYAVFEPFSLSEKMLQKRWVFPKIGVPPNHPF